MGGVPGGLFVLGGRRVGKGEFVKTALYCTTGKTVHITSADVCSHALKPQSFRMNLGGRLVDIYDTVGYDDSSGTNISETPFLRLLEESGECDLYPPLIIVRKLGDKNISWIRKCKHVFPSIAVAYRCSNLQTYEAAVVAFRRSDIFAEKVFRLCEKCPGGGGRSREKYVESVEAILDWYRDLSPTRANFDFESKFFKGEIEKELVDCKTRTEVRTRDVPLRRTEEVVQIKHKKIEARDGGHYETTRRLRPLEERFIEGVFTWPTFFSGGLAQYDTREVYVPDKKDAIVKDSVTCRRKMTRTWTITERLEYETPIYKVWKVLMGNIRVFVERREGEEKLVNVVEVARSVVKEDDDGLREYLIPHLPDA